MDRPALSLACQQVLERPGIPLEAIAIVPLDVERLRARAQVVAKPETLNYRTLKPEKQGLFDEAIFGEIDEGAMPWCEVPDGAVVTSARETTFGRIVLGQPVVHPLFVARATGLVASLAGCDEARVMRLARYEEESRGELVRLLEDSNLVIREVPVLPADMRPMRRRENDRWESSDLNDLYRRVINRSNRSARLVELNAPEIILLNEERMLSEAVTALLVNETLARPVCGVDKAPLMSLLGFAGGNDGVWDALAALDHAVQRGDVSLGKPMAKRFHVAVSALYGMGFEVLPVLRE